MESKIIEVIIDDDVVNTIFIKFIDKKTGNQISSIGLPDHSFKNLLLNADSTNIFLKKSND